MSIVSGVFSMVTIMLLNRNWFARQKLKYDFEKYKVRSKKAGQPSPRNPPPEGPLEWIQKIKDINPEILHNLIDGLGGGSGEGSEESDDVAGTLLEYANKNPKLAEAAIKGFIDKMGKGGQGGGDYLV